MMKYLKYLIAILWNRDLRRAVLTGELNPDAQRWLQKAHASEAAKKSPFESNAYKSTRTNKEEI